MIFGTCQPFATLVFSRKTFQNVFNPGLRIPVEVLWFSINSIKRFRGSFAVKTEESFFPRAYDTSDTLACGLRKVDMRHDHTRISGFSFGPCKLGIESEEKQKRNTVTRFSKSVSQMGITRLKYFGCKLENCKVEL